MNSIDNPVLTDEALRGLADYWRSIGEGRPVPLRRSFEPMSIPSLLPDVCIVEQTRPARRFRYRLIGTRVAEKAGFDATGRFLDELGCGTTITFVIKLLERCVELRQPVASLSSFGSGGRAHLVVRRVFLPMTLGRGSVDQILCGQTFDQRPQAMPSGQEIDRSRLTYQDLTLSSPDAEHEYFDL